MNIPTIIEKKDRHETDLEGQEKPLNREEKLEAGLEESMDASDPPATTAPGDHGDPVPSSGFPGKDAEKAAEKTGEIKKTE